MKRELSHIIQIRVCGASLPGADAAGFVTLSAAVPIDFEEEPKLSSSGLLYKQTADVYIDRRECPRIFTRYTRFTAIVKLSDCQSEYTWGDLYVPVKVVTTPHFERILLSLSCDSLRPVVAY